MQQIIKHQKAAVKEQICVCLFCPRIYSLETGPVKTRFVCLWKGGVCLWRKVCVSVCLQRTVSVCVCLSACLSVCLSVCLPACGGDSQAVYGKACLCVESVKACLSLGWKLVDKSPHSTTHTKVMSIENNVMEAIFHWHAVSPLGRL